MTNKIKIGLFGLGHLGTIHARLLQEVEGFDLIGFYDPSDSTNKEAEKLQLKRYPTAEALINDCEAADIVTTTSAHFELAKAAAQAGKHLFIEKPVTKTVEEAQTLLEIAHTHQVKAMVGHIERFNPALLSLDIATINPIFIEVHRLAQFNPRGTDVSVIHDLMIHDLDIILSLVKSSVRKVYASGVGIVSATSDIANARIEFENGCVANVTASRISLKNMRKMRIFQRGAYLGIDFLKGKTDVLSMHEEQPAEDIPNFEIEIGGAKKFIAMQSFSKQEVNALKMELELFGQSISNNTAVPVGIEDGLKALTLAQQVIDALKKHIEEVKI